MSQSLNHSSVLFLLFAVALLLLGVSQAAKVGFDPASYSVGESEGEVEICLAFDLDPGESVSTTTGANDGGSATPGIYIYICTYITRLQIIIIILVATSVLIHAIHSHSPHCIIIEITSLALSKYFDN